jgi:hypothetical protein
LAKIRKWRRSGRLGPYSDIASLETPDGRTREGKLWRDTHDELVAWVGGQPDAVQAMLIPRICAYMVKVAHLERVEQQGERYDDERVGREKLAAIGAILKLKRELGPDQRKDVRKSKPSLVEYLKRSAEA